jgi:PAS domain S-box-containing protein
MINRNRIFIVTCALLVLQTIETVKASNEPSNTRNSDTVTILGDSYYPPYEYIDENGKPVGFAVDVVKEVMHRLHRPYVLKLTERKNISNLIRKDRSTLIIGASLVEGRNDSLLFGSAFRFVFRNIVMRKADSKRYNKFSDLKDCKVAVEAGSFSLKLLQKEGCANKATAVNSLKDAFSGLESHKYDAIFCESDVAYNIIYNNDYKDIVTKDACLEPFRFGIAGNDSYLLAKIEDALNQMKKEAVYDNMYNKWFKYKQINDYIKYFYYVIFIALVLAIFSIILRLKVKKAREELAIKNLRLSLALKAGNIEVWGYDITKQHFYNVDSHYFPEKGVTLDEINHLIHPDDQQIFKEALNEAAKGNKADTICIRVDRENNKSWAYIEEDIIGIPTKKGTVNQIIGTYKNVTDTILKQQKINELNKRYSQLFNSTVIGTMYYDADGYLIDVNKAACNIFGVKDEQTLLKARTNLFDAPLMKNVIDKNDPKPFSGIIKADFDKKDESGLTLSDNKQGIHYIDTHIIPIFDEKKNLTAITASINDVTENTTLTNKLNESAQKTELAIISANMALWELNLEKMTCTCHNDTINNYNGKDIPIDVILANMDEFDARTARKTLEELRSSRPRYVNINVRILKHSDGTWHHCTITANCLKYGTEQETSTRYIGFCVDNSDVVQLSKEVEDFSSRMKYMLSSIGASEWTFDPDTKVSSSYNASKNKSESLDWHLLLNNVDEGSKQKVMDIFNKMEHRQIDTFSIQVKFLKSYIDEQTTYYSIDGTALKDDSGYILKYTGLSHNISHLMEIQNRLEEEKEKAQQADKLKTAFLANISHEIRTPLNAIIGFSQLLQTEENTEQKSQFINIINDNNEMLLKLINEMLELSKIESGATNGNSHPFNLYDLMQELYDIFSYRQKNPQVKIIYEPAEKDCIINTDNLILKEVISDLLDNALKFTSEGHVKFGFEISDGDIDIFVEDTGIGIPEDKKSIIFEKFEKLDRFTQGVGLGLPICKNDVKLLGGIISVESELGKGSRFSVYLPDVLDQ